MENHALQTVLIPTQLQQKVKITDVCITVDSRKSYKEPKSGFWCEFDS